jgi:hypothetical protein
MADAVTARIIVETRDEAIMVFTNVSDGTGESAVKKVDVSALSGSPTRVFIKSIQYMTSGMDVTILEDADTDVTLAVIGSRLAVAVSGRYDFMMKQEVGGLSLTEATGVTGDIMFTTTGHTAGDSYMIVLHLTKQ